MDQVNGLADRADKDARRVRVSLWLGLAGLTFGGFSSSLVPVMTRIAAKNSIPATTTAFWRVALGAVLVLAIAWPLAPKRRPTRVAIGQSLFLGVVFAVQMVTWFKSVLIVGVGVATVLANTAIFWMAPLGWLLFKERPTRRQIGVMVLAFAGVTFLVNSKTAASATAPYAVGVLLGLGTGLSYALHLAGLRRTGTSSAALPNSMAFLTLGWSLIVSSAGIGLLAFAEGTSLVPPDLPSMGLLCANALAGQLASVAIFLSLPRVAAVVASLVLLLQPALATVWGSAMFDERLSISQLLGVATVLLSVSLGSYLSALKRRARSP